jgi:DNA-binding NarL/FixJ family response regulator
MTASPPNTTSGFQPIILAVDDAADTLSLLTDILESAGMTALVARGGLAALALLDRIRPDLILMDAVMPDLDGFETCRRIKAQSTLAHTPVIFMTGLSDAESVVRGFEAGGVDYVPKPIVASEIIARIRVHLANARMTHSARIALDLSGPPLVASDVAGRILWMTPQGAEMIERSVGSAGGLAAWRGAAAGPLEQAIGRGGEAEIAVGEVRFKAVLIGDGAPGEHLFRLSDTASPSDATRLQGALGLTAREAEVLLWIAQGKSNRDVAAILDCSPRTVNKHLEQIYGKLGVDNRTAAAMIALKRLTSGLG